MENSINVVNRPYYLQNFKSIRFWNYAEPVDIDEIWNDPYFNNIVHYRIVTLENNQMTSYPRLIRSIEKLIGMIDELDLM